MSCGDPGLASIAGNCPARTSAAANATRRRSGEGSPEQRRWGQIVEFSAPGGDPAQVQAGPDGNLWFSDRNGAVGRVTTNGTIARFTTGLNPGSAVRSIAMGPDGNMWFSDPGTTRAIGVINPFTQAISEFSAALNGGCMPLGITAGPDGNVWFTDNGTTKAIGVINPTTHAISELSIGLASIRAAACSRDSWPGGRQSLVHRRRHAPGDRDDQPDH